MAPAEVPLWLEGSGPRASNAVRRDDVVLRRAGPWSPAVIALLHHLAARGFTSTAQDLIRAVARSGLDVDVFLVGV